MSSAQWFSCCTQVSQFKVVSEQTERIRSENDLFSACFYKKIKKNRFAMKIFLIAVEIDERLPSTNE